MSRGLRKLILGGFKGAVLNQQEDEARRERQAEIDRKVRERVLAIVGDNPEAFPDAATTPKAPKLPEIVAPRTVDEAAPAPPMPLVGQKAAPLPTRVQAPVSSDEAAPEFAVGIRASLPKRQSPLMTMTEGEAAGRVTSYRQRRNETAFEGLGLADDYDPGTDYTKEWAKKQTEEREKGALYKHYIAQGMAEADARDLAETGGKVITARRQQESESRAEESATRAEATASRAERRDARIERSVATSESNRARDRMEKQRRASIDGNAAKWVREGRGTDEIAHRITQLWPDFNPGEAMAIATEAIRDEKRGKKAGAGGASDLDEYGDPVDDSAPAVTTAAKPSITQAERKQLIAAGHSEAEIKAHYTVGR